MGVEARVLLYAQDEERAQAAAKAAFDRMVELDRVLSDYQLESELNQLVARGAGVAVPVSEDLYRVLAASQELSGQSGGAFDVTVKPLAKLWSQALAEGREPEDQALEAVGQRIGFQKLSLDPLRRTVFCSTAGMALDLGAIGKGYACDEALKVLRRKGVERALVELGGDLVLGAPPPGRKGWTISAGCGDRQTLLTLRDCAVATSGDTEQFVLLDGVRYSHILDPRSRRPLVDSMCVSVVAEDGMTADGLASAASVLGLAAGQRLVAAHAGARVEFADPRRMSLFDGETLDGWVTSEGSSDGEGRFFAEDGALTGRLGPGDAAALLSTERPYTSFELELDSFIDPALDSVLWLRLAPDSRAVQVPLDERPAAGNYLEGEWNHFVVRVTGFDLRIQVWLNGEPIADDRLQSRPETAPAGRIGLQVRRAGDDLQNQRARFKNLRIRELPVFGEGLSGFEPLYDGNGLGRFEPVGKQGGYRQRRGVLEFLNDGGSGELRTVEDFRNFRLRLEFLPSRMANSGVFLRAARDHGSPSSSGCEVQILDDFHWETVTGTRLKPWQFCGSLYGCLAPGSRALRPIGEWNTYEILYRGSRLAVALNGTTLFDVDTFLIPGASFRERAKSGFIGLQRHLTPQVEGDVAIRFREVWVERLEDD